MKILYFLTLVVPFLVHAHPELVTSFLKNYQAKSGSLNRMIQLNETNIIYIPNVEFEKFLNFAKSNDLHFMDITDYTEFYKHHSIDTKTLLIPSRPTKQEIVKPLLLKISQDRLTDKITKLSSFFTRYYTSQTGYDAVVFMKTEYEKIIQRLPAERQKLFSVSFYQHSWKQPSLIVKFKGTTLPDEHVVLGAHIDSIAGTLGTGRAPGADDDASGSSTIFEVFRVIAESNYLPKRSIEFQHYAAEEVGLRGSQDIATKYSKEKKNVFAMINMDMTGYTSSRDKAAGIATDFTDSGVTAFLRKLVSEYSQLLQGDIRCGYACSDHASFQRVGYRAAHIFEASPISSNNKNIHTANDVIGNLDLRRAVEFIKVCLSFAIEFASF